MYVVERYQKWRALGEVSEKSQRGIEQAIPIARLAGRHTELWK